MPESQPAIGGDLGISAECPTAPSSTISAVAASSTSAHARRERRRPLRGAVRASAEFALRGDVHDAARLTRLSRRSSSPGRRRGRRGRARGPSPDALKPPNGAAGSALPHVLMYTEPARSIAASRWALPTSRVHTPAARPYSPSLARCGDLLERVVGRGDEHRAEDLLAGDLQLVGGRREQRRRDEVAAAVGERGLAAGDQLGALLAPGLDVAHHAVALLGRDERAELGVGVQPRAELRRVRRLAERRHHLVEAVGRHEQARARVAGLAGVEVDRPGRSP